MVYFSKKGKNWFLDLRNLAKLRKQKMIIVEKEDFDMMKERYIQNLQELRDELQAAKQKQRMLEKKADRYMDMVNNLEPYLSERSFNEKLVQELVEYVEIYKNGNIHVCFKCDDKFQQITELIEGVRSAEERIIS